jgi:transcription initiation factor TFIIB
MNTCPECGSRNQMFMNNEEICNECGLVLDDAPMDQEFINSVQREYAHQPYLATAGSQNVDGRVFKALWILSTREKNLKQGNEVIDVIASEFNLIQSVIQESKLIFKKILYTNTTIGRDNISLIYASVYTACIIHGTPKTARELTLNSELTPTQLMRGYRTIKKKLEIIVQPIDPIDLLPRFASKLELTQETISKAIEILTQIKEKDILAGKKPESILSGAIYLAGIQNNNIRTQRQLSFAIGLTEVTTRAVVKEIKKSF